MGETGDLSLWAAIGGGSGRHFILTLIYHTLSPLEKCKCGPRMAPESWMVLRVKNKRSAEKDGGQTSCGWGTLSEKSHSFGFSVWSKGLKIAAGDF